MKYKSTLFDTAAGSLGQHAFVRGAAGPQIKGRAQRIQTPSQAQFTTQQITSAISSEWAALSEAGQENWRLVASILPLTDVLGNEYHMTGHNLYVQLNSNQYFSGQARSSTAPITPDTVPNIGTLSIAASATSGGGGSPSIVCTLGSAPGGYALVIRATAAYSSGVIAPASSRFKLIGHASAGFSTTLDITSDYLAILPAPVAAKRLSVAMFLVSPHGFAGQIVTASTLITA